MAATSRRGEAKSPFHWALLAGQAVHIAFCGAHSGFSEIVLPVIEIVVMPPLLWAARSSNQAAMPRHGGGFLADPKLKGSEAVIGGANPRW
jgi:hypothetical protein